MHAIVVLRYIFFLLSPAFHIALAVADGIAVQKNVPLVGVPLSLFLAVLGALVLCGLIAFDLHRKKSGYGFFCFVTKIWFELAIITSLMVIDTATFFIVFTQNQTHPCLLADSDVPFAHVKPCHALRLIWIFQILVPVSEFLYVVFLGAVSLKHYIETPKVFSAAVRDFPWGIPNAASKRSAPDPHRPVYFPTSTLPTYEVAFAGVQSKLEEGRVENHLPSRTDSHWM